MELKDKIKFYREKRNMSKSELARQIGVYPAYITKLENGDKKNPSLEIKVKLAKALDCPINELFIDEDLFGIPSIGEKIKYYRNKISMTQSKLASKAGISLRALSNYESGLRTPQLEVKLKIASALNIKVTDLDPDTEPYKELENSRYINNSNKETTIGKNIRSIRKSKGLTLRDIANKLDITEQAISQYERDIRIPNTKLILKIASILNVSPHEIDSDLEIDNKGHLTLGKRGLKEMNKSVEASIKIYEQSGVYKLRIDISDVFKPDIKHEELLTKIIENNSILISDIVYIKFYDIATDTSYLINLNRINRFELSNITDMN